MLVLPFGAGKLPVENIRSATTTSGAGTSCSITLAATTTAPVRYVLHNVQWSYSAAPTGGKLTIATGSGPTTVKEVDITAAGPGGYNMVVVAANQAQMVVTLAAPGGAVVGKLNIDYSISNE